MKYCQNCGKELKEGADICLNCGKMLNQSQPTVSVKEKKPGKGKAIASLVLGIISILWTLSMLAGLEMGVESLTVEYYYNNNIVYFVAYYIGYTLFALTPGIVGIILGINSNKTKKSGMATAGIILTSIALVSCLFVLIRFITA